MEVKMEKKQKVLELRERLDKTLALPDLANEESIKSLVTKQLLRSSWSGMKGDIEPVVEKRAREVSNFLEMLRSASGGMESLKAHGTSQSDWKIKQDTDRFRVMYREGPHGTPFHTLLTEGYVDGPIDVCLCVSWESTLYKKWWPQYNLPTFKITMSTCLQKVRIGEEISLVRVKVAWPVSDREALLHYFEIEYLKEDLILVLINTISDSEHIDISTHGFSRDGIPEAKDTVRVDLVGGFVLQKASANRSYFRAIANMDIKLDFVPPSLINFISRQLLGSGYKLYQKAVGTVATSDDDYRRALEGPMYIQVREGLDSHNKFKTDLVGTTGEKLTGPIPGEHTVKTTVEATVEATLVTDSSFVSEIVEEEPERHQCLELDQVNSAPATNPIAGQEHVVRDEAFVSPEVEHALGILDSAITIIRNRGSNILTNCSSADQQLLASEAAAEAGSASGGDAIEIGSNMEKTSASSEARSLAKGSRNSTVESAPLSKERFAILGNTEAIDFRISSHNKLIESKVTMAQPPVLESMRRVCDEGSIKTDCFHENGLYEGTLGRNREKKNWFCCFSSSFVRS
ncbi:uncharacterized protein LOC103707495 [Phoenix dactylifera]|uniref:Uncharacterized protein LOC103707495 n=1 Tax=Phoenix dactylifera TaxID=42345 RepID=A0A8B7C2E6_PHODC|nr:uncharacterized protein LOC103707495 [Phoenix dactylifera]XP_008790246.2 uncharacterized protein LOC103707495 [Phoenix dactylifera]XP_008790263.2 uncharacterized protein LOC103707495 [Phoenix dactylifera]XP_008790279.2 uncharacterized protein LOC103707495 [Phoenix dactylifera]XP_008790287.2 uncharacterized protein LOC103707495 [Phoenix dactylifera]XP_008790294.2 uncharacterized protein LOC103707495 [Phoenix dactylifera]XP_008790301.2 uncharacterized protein LOC103707495 [Phoenix dactylifer